MENTPYNQKIQQQVMEINARHLRNLDATGKQVLESNLVPLVKPLVKYDESVKEGSGLFSGLLDTFGLGAPTSDEGKKAGRRGRPRKSVKAGMEASGIFSGILDSIGLGKEDQEKLKGAGLFDDIARGFTTGFKMPFQLVNKVLGGAKTKKLKAGLIKIAKGRQMGGYGSSRVGGYKAHYGMPSKTIKSGNGINARAVGSGNDMEGAGIFDDVGEFVGNFKKVLPLAKMIGIGKKQRGRPRKGGAVGVDAMAEHRNALTGGGPLSGLLGAIGLGEEKSAGRRRGKGAKCGGASLWIQHCKAYAKKHKLSFKDAMKDPKCKSSYKK